MKVNLMALGRGPDYCVFHELWVLSPLLVRGLPSQLEQSRGGQTMPMGQIQPQTYFYFILFFKNNTSVTRRQACSLVYELSVSLYIIGVK